MEKYKREKKLTTQKSEGIRKQLAAPSMYLIH